MGQSRLRHLARMVGLLGRPVPERRPETVRHRVDPEPLEHSGKRGAVEGLPTQARKHQRTSSTERPRLFEDLQRTATERNPVLAVRLRAPGWGGPHPIVQVDRRPRGPPDLSGAGRRQHEQLECQLYDRLRARRPHLPDCRRDLPVRQRLHLPDDVVLRAESRTDPVAGVVRPEFHRHGPLHDRPDALAQLPGRGRLLVPERLDACARLE